ncbi:MAG: hypothetical protein V7K41_28185 [Nostoc sp.]|uniref:hypothetical protein n=1 Tax=Nostoc sp. TaxID=1180 RepID=UPI002FF7FE6F
MKTGVNSHLSVKFLRKSITLLSAGRHNGIVCRRIGIVCQHNAIVCRHNAIVCQRIGIVSRRIGIVCRRIGIAGYCQITVDFKESEVHNYSSVTQISSNTLGLRLKTKTGVVVCQEIIDE